MKSRICKNINQPFQGLDQLVKNKRIELALKAKAPRDRRAQTSTPENESKLFNEAMADVTPLICDRHWRPPQLRKIRPASPSDDDNEAMRALKRLIQTGRGFIIAQTAEYMEATSPGIGPEIARRLHRGRYAIQDNLDLHGLTAAEADKTMHLFIHRALKKGYRAVLIVHGRGLTSPCKPVLKKKVLEWLTKGPLRRHVIALASARACDGGAGATYVLLRRKPMTKRMRKI